MACENEEHKMHMCALKERGYDEQYPEQFQEMIADPEYRCDNCGAEAKKAENLCKPVRL